MWKNATFKPCGIDFFFISVNDCTNYYHILSAFLIYVLQFRPLKKREWCRPHLAALGVTECFAV